MWHKLSGGGSPQDDHKGYVTHVMVSGNVVQRQEVGDSQYDTDAIDNKILKENTMVKDNSDIMSKTVTSESEDTSASALTVSSDHDSSVAAKENKKFSFLSESTSSEKVAP